MVIDLCSNLPLPFLASKNLKPLLQLQKVSETLAVFSKMAEVNCPDALELYSTLTVMQSYTALRGMNGPTLTGNRVCLGTLMNAMLVHSCRWTAAYMGQCVVNSRLCVHYAFHCSKRFMFC